MKCILAFALLSLSLATAQDVSSAAGKIPQCANACVSSAFKKFNCANNDWKCFCTVKGGTYGISIVNSGSTSNGTPECGAYFRGGCSAQDKGTTIFSLGDVCGIVLGKTISSADPNVSGAIASVNSAVASGTSAAASLSASIQSSNMTMLTTDAADASATTAAASAASSPTAASDAGSMVTSANAATAAGVSASGSTAGVVPSQSASKGGAMALGAENGMSGFALGMLGAVLAVVA